MEDMKIKLELPDVANEALKPLAQSIGNTLNSIWNICFGWIDYTSDKYQYKRQLNLNAFKDELEREICKIPEEKLCEPELSVVGPALEASKYYFEESSLRQMFAKLIASSMNSNLHDYVQNSFVDVIRQMSPFDAILLNQFDAEGDLPILQIASVQKSDLSSDSDGLFCKELYCTYQIIKNTYYYNGDVPELLNCNTALLIDDLLRLGLIMTPHDSFLPKDELYKCYEDDPYITGLISEYEADTEMAIRFLYRAATFTDYGRYFVKVCL